VTLRYFQREDILNYSLPMSYSLNVSLILTEDKAPLLNCRNL